MIAVLAPQVTSQAQDLVDRASAGLSSLQSWAAGPPFNLGPDALGGLLDKGVKELQNNSQQVAGVVIGSLGAIGSAVVTFVLALVLCFFFLKDGPRFLPWLRSWIGVAHGRAHRGGGRPGLDRARSVRLVAGRGRPGRRRVHRRRGLVARGARSRCRSRC